MTTSIDLVGLVYNSCFLLILVLIELFDVRLKKTGRSPNGNMLERLKKHEPRRTRSLLVVFNA